MNRYIHWISRTQGVHPLKKQRRVSRKRYFLYLLPVLYLSPRRLNLTISKLSFTLERYLLRSCDRLSERFFLNTTDSRTKIRRWAKYTSCVVGIAIFSSESSPLTFCARSIIVSLSSRVTFWLESVSRLVEENFRENSSNENTREKTRYKCISKILYRSLILT